MANAVLDNEGILEEPIPSPGPVNLRRESRVSGAETNEESGAKVFDEHRLSSITYPDGRTVLSPIIHNDEPTAEELKELRHVADRIPRGVWLVSLIVLSERFVYYGLTTPLQNYMQNPRNEPLQPGALGLGQTKATDLSYFFSTFNFLTPVFGAFLADGVLGRYKTLVISCCVYLAGSFILFVTSLPVSLHEGAGLGGLITGMILVGLGIGGFKSCTSAFIADQYTETKFRIKTTSKGERVIVDRNVTIESIYHIYYWCMNVGSFSVIASTFLEKKVGYWAAFLVPFSFLWIVLLVLLFGIRYFVVLPPQGTILSKAAVALFYGARGGFKMDSARPLQQLEKHSRTVDWDDGFVDGLCRALLACRVFLPWPILWLCQSQMSSNLISMAANMQTHGVPNDLFQVMNPISVIILLPMVHNLLFPFLRKVKIPFRPVSRMTLGFVLEAVAMAYAAILQNAVYKTGPCFEHPRVCAAAGSAGRPNNISAFLQLPIYVIEGFGEIFSSAAGYEYAYTKAPASMKSVIQAIFLLSAATGNFLGFSMSPLYIDPKLTIFFSVLAGLMGTVAVAFWLLFKKYNAVEEHLNRLSADSSEKDSRTSATSVEDGTTIGGNSGGGGGEKS